MRISQLGRKVRGDKGGPKVGDLLKSMKKKKMGEEVDQVDEAKMGEIARNVKKGDSPYTVVAIVNNKVVDQDHAKIPNQVPALVRELKKEYPNAKISVEDRGGRVVHSESFEVENEETGAQKVIAKYKKRAADAQKWKKDNNKKSTGIAERSKSKKDIRNFKEFSEAKLRIPKETGTPGMTKARGPKTPYEKAKAFIAAHQRDNKGKHPTQAQLDKALELTARNQGKVRARKPVVVARKAWNEEFSENEK